MHKIFDGYHEIVKSLDTLADMEFYISRFPYRSSQRSRVERDDIRPFGFAGNDGFVGDGFVSIASEGGQYPTRRLWREDHSKPSPAIMHLSFNDELQAKIAIPGVEPLTCGLTAGIGTAALLELHPTHHCLEVIFSWHVHNRGE